ncbi:hypothetical protein B0H15DRAFT_829629 [Mycena belliarum]|uniref:Uncharacterized protein n=1 Tax=Mycena belliarum TaxID=1033014 RepID=A0AAD6XRJ2_9AGAR|nr:hypothetical protein B0H15DRAFT_829629 [Mycena belliae]
MQYGFSAAQLVALSVFCSYFSIIAGLLVVIWRSLPLRAQSVDSRAYVFVALALASFAHTWFYMFGFMAWSFADYERAKNLPEGLLERLSRWLLDTSLFEQAWASVCFGEVNWWWSQQLCLFTVGTWTIFMATEGPRHQIKLVWAYMLLGQLVAISVASNLFYLALVLAGPPPRASSPWAPPALWIPVLLSLGAVARSPFTDEYTFLPNLLAMHLLIVVPLVVPTWGTPRFSLRLSTLYVLVFIAALAMHTRATSNALGEPAVSARQFVRNAWQVLHSHPAQASIGWDVIWTTVSFVAWILLRDGAAPPLLTAAYLTLATPLASVGVLAPHILRSRDDEPEKSKSH